MIIRPIRGSSFLSSFNATEVNSTLLGAITVGDHVVVGVNAIVLKDVEANTKVPPGTIHRT
jgi:hypothetical protein